MLLESWMRWDGCARLSGNRKQGRESNRPFITFYKECENDKHSAPLGDSSWKKKKKLFPVWPWETPAARLADWLTTSGRGNRCASSAGIGGVSQGVKRLPRWMLPVSAQSHTEECFKSHFPLNFSLTGRNGNCCSSPLLWFWMKKQHKIISLDWERHIGLEKNWGDVCWCHTDVWKRVYW